MKLIFAGNYREFAAYCRMILKPPMHPEVAQQQGKALYIADINTLRGRRFSKDDVVLYGTVHERRDYHEICREIEHRAVDAT